MFVNCHYKYPTCTIMRIALNYKQNRKPSNEPFDSTKFVKAGIVYIRVYIRCILIHQGIDVSFQINPSVIVVGHQIEKEAYEYAEKLKNNKASDRWNDYYITQENLKI